MIAYIFLYVYALISSLFLIEFSRAGASPQKMFWPSLIVFCVVWSFFLGYRHEVGTDYYSYLLIFEGIAENSIFVTSRYEPGFLLINSIFYYAGLGGNSVLFFFYVSSFLLLVSSIKNMGINNATTMAIGVVLLIGLGPVFAMTNTVRQQFVVAMSVFFVTKFYERKVFSALLSSIVGIFFHYSSVVACLYCFIPKKRLSFFSWFLLSALTIFFSVKIIPVIFTFLEGNKSLLGGFAVYLNSERELLEGTGLGLRAYFELMIFLTFSLFTRQLGERAVYIFNIAFVGVLLMLLLKELSLFQRFAAYFYAFSYLALSCFYLAFKKPWRYLYFIFVLIYSAALFYRNISTDQFYPYRLVFFHM